MRSDFIANKNAFLSPAHNVQALDKRRGNNNKWKKNAPVFDKRARN